MGGERLRKALRVFLRASALPLRTIQETWMHITFEAKKVSYSEALDGDIVQVVFDADDSDEATEVTKPYLLVSANYEFPPVNATTEWHDGNDFDGGAKMIRVEMDMSRLCVWLDNDMSFEIFFEISEQKYRLISSFLVSVVDQRRA